jgi:glycosyltransferase involved in cell wall biosynthesis
MHFGIPIVTWNVVYNRETTEGKAYYFSTPEELLDITRRVDLSGNNMQEIAQRRYTWKTISKQYCELFRIK